MSKHLKRLAAPRVLRIPRKERALTIRAAPGPHPFEQAIPLGLLLRDYLGLCDTYKEARKIVSNGDIFVDAKKRKSFKFPCGLMDVKCGDTSGFSMIETENSLLCRFLKAMQNGNYAVLKIKR